MCLFCICICTCTCISFSFSYSIPIAFQTRLHLICILDSHLVLKPSYKNCMWFNWFLLVLTYMYIAHCTMYMYNTLHFVQPFVCLTNIIKKLGVTISYRRCPPQNWIRETLGGRKHQCGVTLHGNKNVFIFCYLLLYFISVKIMSSHFSDGKCLFNVWKTYFLWDQICLLFLADHLLLLTCFLG